MIPAALFRALSQIADPRFRRVLFLGLALTIALLIVVTTGFVWLAGALVGEEVALPFIGQVQWMDDVLGWGSLLLMIGLSVFLMVPVASAIISLFLEQVADAVEERHYPHLPKATPVPFWDGVRDALGFLGVLILANIGAFVLYLVLPFAAIFIFWGLNGFLLGREYFTLTALRRVGRQGARDLRRRHAGRIWAAGVLMAVPLTIPVVNLLVPILGAATFTHLFHMLRGER